ncbi:major facilitator transporter [Skermanella stibiiresistens SB22]|uniref:Major facilitator transporter n=2 Tax=Skermanella TaxID=204447 RepID=W9H0R7_9PROT|nr:major facilitator transporter [Skermanella stibiiresistens SB22]
MPSIVRSISSLLIAVALLMLGSGMLSTLVGVRLSSTEVGPVAIGFVMAAYYAGLTAGSLFGYRVIVKVGHIRAFSAFASIFSAATLGHALWLNLPFWALLRLAEGFCMAGLFMCIESWLNERATSGTRGRMLSLYMITLYGAMAIGQQLLNLDDPTGMLRFIAISILTSLALVPVALTRNGPPMLPNIASFGIRRLYEASPLGIFGTFVSGLVTGAIYGLAPVYGTGAGFGTAGTALFMTVIILGGVALQWPLGKLSDLFDRRTVIIGLSAATAAASLGMIAAAGMESQIPLMLVAALFGGLSFTIYPVCVAHTNDHIDKSELVQASGGLILAYSVGATIGPLAGSAVMSALGNPGLFTFTAAGAATAVVFGLYRAVQRPALPAEAQGPFQSLPRTTPVVAPLDPRGGQHAAG